MLYIETTSTNAAFHFSVEEFFMQNYRSEPLIMIWQADKCVMLGAHQVGFAEVNMDYAEQMGIQIVRRSSGGGAIFTDMGTLLYTMIQPYQKGQVQQIAKETIVTSVLNALKKMGVPAGFEGRNDILVNGKKISGIAQYMRNGMLCTHGSLLYDTNLDLLVNALNVDDEKIRSKAIRSVRSRVTNIKEYLNISTQDFLKNLQQNIITEHKAQRYPLTEKELTEINQIRCEKYENPSWTFGKTPKFSFSNSRRFPEGKVEVYIDATNGIVTSCAIRGDFLGTVPMRTLEEKLENIMFEFQAFSNALNEVVLQPYLGDLTKEQLLSCIFEQEAVK